MFRLLIWPRGLDVSLGQAGRGLHRHHASHQTRRARWKLYAGIHLDNPVYIEVKD